MLAHIHWFRRIGLLLVAGIALSGSGCLAVAAGAVAAGGVASVVYLKAPVTKEFSCDLPNAQAAAQVALQDLGMPVLGAKQEKGEVVIGSRTGDGSDIDITLQAVLVHVPAEGPKTRAEVRIGFAGDKELSERFLDQMGKRLQGGGPPIAAAAPPLLVTNQTAPPPLATAPPAPQTAPPPLATGPNTGPPPLATNTPLWQPKAN